MLIESPVLGEPLFVVHTTFNVLLWSYVWLLTKRIHYTTRQRVLRAFAGAVLALCIYFFISSITQVLS